MMTWSEFWYLTVAIKNVKQVPESGFIYEPSGFRTIN